MAEDATPRRRLRHELVLVTIVAVAFLLPGIDRYTLVDPWETHYGEVTRNMLVDHDYVHTQWPGLSYTGARNEGFRSKPVLLFWVTAASMKAVGVDGSYSGQMTESVRTMIGMRLPIVAAAVAGLVLLWWMLARLVSRRLAWLALLVVGSCPMFCFIARQAIPDMLMVSTVIGALALFVMAIEDGERPVTAAKRRAVVAIASTLVVVQAAYYAAYFVMSPQLAVRGVLVSPALWLPALMLWLVCSLARDGWLIVRLPCILLGGVIAGIAGAPLPRGVRDVLWSWERYAPDRYLVRALPLTLAVALGLAHVLGPVPGVVTVVGVLAIVATAVVWALVIAAAGWAGTQELADRLLAVRPLVEMRQLYLLGCYTLLGIGLLAKGPPGFTVVAGVAALYVVYFGRWRALWHGAFELKRGIVLVFVLAIPWHVAMWLKEGPRFVDEYLYQHILNRAGDGSVDKSLDTFAHYTTQLGYGMWLWAGLVPVALAVGLMRARRDTREGRVRFVAMLWAIVSVAVFCLVQTKFHHYALPLVPPLGLLVAFWLDDVIARRERLHPLAAAVGAAIVLLVCRDLMFEPERWIEMFVYRYDRPWPTAEPYSIDPSDGFLVLGVIATLAVMVTSTRFARIGVALAGCAGIAIGIWALQVYMPIAGTHWGMREAVRTYYDERTVYGEKLVYYADAQLAADWKDAGDTWSIETVVPETLQLGQPMTVTVELDQPPAEQTITLAGTASQIGEHSIEVSLHPGERAKLQPLVERGLRNPRRARPPVRFVDADRLIAYQLYWRGEQFWSGGEIWGPVPELQTSFPNGNTPEWQAYINDRTRAPLGRRYFILSEAGRTPSLRSLLPTQRAKDTFEILDTTSNKFWLAAFYL
ncbi:MAG TPA: hypothetical protein VFQ53_30475 [Kofleriaceae bacterium]|nr:hypothetical protein [Kofleriaceae bacterium]